MRQEDKMKKLFKAIRNGDFNEVKEIITKKPELISFMLRLVLANAHLSFIQKALFQ